MKLRPYQEEAIQAIESGWEDYKRELLVLPTGCGKTIVFNSIAHKHNKVLILAHREELIDQAIDKYKKMFAEPVGKIKAEINDVENITVGSIQTMSRRRYDSNMFGYIIIDEAHHAVSDEYQRFLKQFPNSYVLGVTATADRAGKKQLADYFDTIAYQYTLKQAIKEGYLCPIKAQTVPLDIDLTNVKISIGDFEVNSIAETLEPYLPEIAKSIKKYAGNRKTVVFLPLVHIAQQFQDELLKIGLDSREVNGNSSDRKETLEWFDKAPKGSILCNAMLLTEGWDCPSCDCVVVLRPTKVRSLYTQMIGRGTRLAPGKKDLLILDFLWLSTKHNLCKPASLVSDNDTDIETVSKKSEAEQIDLFGALTDAEESRKAALAEALRKKAKKKARLIDPIELFDLLDDMDLANHEDVFKWQKEDATEKQIETLEKFGIDAEGITKGYAAAIMDRAIERSKKGYATLKQVHLLKKYHYDAVNWSFIQASDKIKALAAVGWKRYRLKD